MSTSTHTAGTNVERALLRHLGLVYLPAGDATEPATAGLALLEAELADHGWLVSGPVRTQLAGLDPATLVSVGVGLLDNAAANEGHPTGVSARPLFRQFPHHTPANPGELFMNRMVAAYLQGAQTPCLLCEAQAEVRPVAPCGHPVCPTCFDPAQFSGCPVCGHQLNPGDAYLVAGATQDPARRRVALHVKARYRVLHCGTDQARDARTLLSTLLARPTALSPADIDVLDALLAAQPSDDLAWLPEAIPARDTKARTLAWVTTASTDPVTIAEALTRVDTATDILRVLAVRSGGPADLTTTTRHRTVSRPLRRALLARLEQLCVDGKQHLLAEDMVARPQAWKRAGETLHPREHAAKFPQTAALFALIRASDVAAGEIELSSKHLALRDHRIAYTSWAAQAERALEAADTAAAARVLSQRPGELFRRLDHALRTLDDTAAVLAAATQVAQLVSTAVLCSSLGAFRTRGSGPGRVFFPAGGTARTHLVPDDRKALPAGAADQVQDLITSELLRRAGDLPAVRTALVDSDLTRVVAPFGERTAARALVTLTRGTVLPLPAATNVRMFCHWVEPETEVVDLDLSVMLFDADWDPRGECAYTHLSHEAGAQHSGDFTSAPGPAGAAEYVDLDLDSLSHAGVRYVLAAVYSYNNVPFDQLVSASSGLMALPEDYDQNGNTPAAVFDARAVEQRFDLTGNHRAHLPLLIDVETRTWMWLDVAQGSSGVGAHATWNTGERAAGTVAALHALFTSGARVSIGELALAHAAARAAEVRVRSGKGERTYLRRPRESVSAFRDRITEGSEVDQSASGPVDLAFLVSGAGVDITPGGSVYALYPQDLDARRVQMVAAHEVSGVLGPEPRAVSHGLFPGRSE